MKIVITRLSGLFLTVFLVVVNAILIEIILDLFGVEGHMRISYGLSPEYLSEGLDRIGRVLAAG